MLEHNTKINLWRKLDCGKAKVDKFILYFFISSHSVAKKMIFFYKAHFDSEGKAYEKEENVEKRYKNGEKGGRKWETIKFSSLFSKIIIICHQLQF